MAMKDGDLELLNEIAKFELGSPTKWKERIEWRK